MLKRTSRALTLLLAATILTTCGDDSSSSKDDRGVFGETADALQSAQDDFLTANAEIFASAEYMQPYISELLNEHAQGTESASAPSSCLPEGVGGRTYTINGVPFTSVEDSLVPDHTARFRLFKLSSTGQPLLNRDIGYMDCTCTGTDNPVTEIHLFSSPVEISSMTYSPLGEEPGDFTGLLRTPNASSTITFHGSVRPGFWLMITFQISDTLEATYLFDRPGDDRGVQYWIEVHSSNSSWRHDGRVRVDAGGLAFDGYATKTDSLIEICACVDGGTLDSPDFGTPRTDCADTVRPVVAVTPAELQAMTNCYQSLRVFWLTTRKSVETCRSLVPANP